MNDQEIRESIKTLKLFNKHLPETEETKELSGALCIAINHLTSYLSIAEPREILKQLAHYQVKLLTGDNTGEYIDKMVNKRIDQALSELKLYHLRQIEGLEKVILNEFEKKAMEDKQEVIKEVNKHGLSDVNSWDNKEAGFFDMKDFAKTLATAICQKLGVE